MKDEGRRPWQRRRAAHREAFWTLVLLMALGLLVLSLAVATQDGIVLDPGETEGGQDVALFGVILSAAAAVRALWGMRAR
ncbi:MAG: hypothetical protein RIF41_04060 [Polyangiaceae bacterium]